MASLSMATMVSSYRIDTTVPSASLSLFTGSRARPSGVSIKTGGLSSSSGLLHCSFVGPSSSLSFSSNSTFSGLSLGWDWNSGSVAGNTQKRRGLVVQAKKYALCQTKRNRSRKSLARTHGFRKRMSTTGGRAVLQRRRAKGRWDLCPKTNPNSGKRA